MYNTYPNSTFILDAAQEAAQLLEPLFLINKWKWHYPAHIPEAKDIEQAFLQLAEGVLRDIADDPLGHYCHSTGRLEVSYHAGHLYFGLATIRVNMKQ